ncbi:putative helicase [Mycobacteroides abscessus]|uniref:DEAD/DEAH box helicase n=1 Tax=Mycobacteroides abscessus TaxID=36809 RepID=UPI0005DAC8C4|nr:DEAD/DEAH box helicase [Mycobacteroides abscessus]CPU61320.1 putative helicase [Mycobacteroides abscessus]
MKGHVKATTVPAPKLRVRPLNTLRQHQIDAIASVQTGDARQQLIMACGTGKTLTGQHAVAKLIGKQPGTVLVLVPTLSLLEQTFQAWAAHAPFGFDAIAVCSKLTPAEKRSVGTEDDTDTSQLALAATTVPAELADFLASPGQTMRVVFGTYQSLDTVIAAHADHGAEPWNIVVCDEAHRTAGAKAKPFARALHDTFVPARQRLFLTATPRVHTVSEKESGSEKSTLLASMDDETLYGKQVYTLSVAEAIEKNILSQYRVAVIGVEDAELHAAARTLETVKVGGNNLSVDHVASIVALSKAAQQYGLQAIIAFFNSIKSSKSFRDAFNTVHASQVGEHLGEGRAEHIDGAMKLEKRRAALTRLAQNRENGFYLVSNARCLSEGIDVPVLDAVFFGEARSSQIEVVQCVGRAIRKNPRHDNPALIVMGVRIGAGEDIEVAVDESQFKKIRQVIAALADHDPRIADAARVLARSGGSNPDDSVDEKINWAKELLALELPESLLHSGFGLRMLDAGYRSWEKRFAEVSQHAQRTGNVTFPRGDQRWGWVIKQRSAFRAGTLSSDRIEQLESLPGLTWDILSSQWDKRFREVSRFAQLNAGVTFPKKDPRGNWAGMQRRAFRVGKLSPERIARLESLPGWSWEVLADQWESMFEEVSRHIQLTGNVTFPRGDQRWGWVIKQRKAFRVGKLSPERIARLESLPGWSWEVLADQWESMFEEVSRHVQLTGNVTFSMGDPRGNWINTQRNAFRAGKLSPERIARLESLPGWSWEVLADQWESMFEEVSRHVRLAGSASIPQRERLGQWISKQRQVFRVGKLSPERITRLESLPGWSWDALTDQWESMFEEVSQHLQLTGNVKFPERDTRRQWVAYQRSAFRAGKLSAERTKRLEALPGWSWNPLAGRKSGNAA